MKNHEDLNIIQENVIKSFFDIFAKNQGMLQLYLILN